MFLYYFLLFITGSCFASFYYLLAARLPRKEQIGWTRSRCEQCYISLQPQDLIPIFSYLKNRGRCRYCKHSLPLTYPFYEWIGGIFLVSIFWKYGHALSPFVFHSLLYSILFLIAAVDQQYFIIPDRLQLSLAALLVISHMQAGTLLDSGFYLSAFAMLLVSIFSASFMEDGLGGGDVKLLILFGFGLGFQQATFVLFLASLTALFYVGYRFWVKKLALASPIPFGPFLVFAFFFVREVW